MNQTADTLSGSIAVYVIDQLKAYYMFGASDPALRNSPTGTAVLWDAFSELAKVGVKKLILKV